METVYNFLQVLAASGAMLLLVYLAFLFFNVLVFPTFKFGDALRKGNVAVGIFLAGLFLGLFLFAGLAMPAAPDSTLTGGRGVKSYDRDFRKWGLYEFGMRVDWMNFKAQGMTESNLKADVCSHVGACGLMQFMAPTAGDMGLQDRFDAKESIRLGIKYDKRLWNVFAAPRPNWDRLAFAFMAYNAGLGNVLKFQQKAVAAGVDPNLFHTVKYFAWTEPREYVLRIERWRKRFRKGVYWTG